MATIPRSFIMMNSIDEVTDDESSMASGCDNEVESVLSIQGYENHFLGCADEMKLPESFNIVADESQRTCVIIYYDCVVGRFDGMYLQCRGLRCFTCLGFFFSVQPYFLQSVSLVDCQLNSDHLHEIFEVFRTYGHCSLTSLDLSHNVIGSKGAVLLADFVKDLGLKELRLCRSRLCDIWTERGVVVGTFCTSGICSLLKAVRFAGSDKTMTKHLEVLDISRNMLGQDEELLDALSDLIRSDISNLSMLNLTGNYFDEADFFRLCDSMKCNAHILSYCGPRCISSYCEGKAWIKLRSCNLAPLDAFFIVSDLRRSAVFPTSIVDLSWNREFGVGFPSLPRDALPFLYLHTLKLRSIGMDAIYASALRDVLVNPNCRISSLDIAGNAGTLGSDGMEHLLMGLKNNKSLRFLGMVSCVPKDFRNYDLMQDAIEANSFLVDLDISQSHDCAFDATAVYRALKVNRTLRCVSLSRCDINAASVDVLTEVINLGNSLTSLDLSSNSISAFAWNSGPLETPLKSFMAALCQFKPNSLPAHWSPVSVVPQTVSEKSHLMKLDISNNKLYPNVFKSLSAALMNEKFFLESLNISSCGIGRLLDHPPICQQFSEAISRNSSLSKLHIKNNSLGVHGIEIVLSGISSNRSLRLVDLSANNKPPREDHPVHNQGQIITALKNCLKFNKYIERIDLRRNHMFGKDVEENSHRSTAMNELRCAIKTNSENGGRLVWLNISDNSYHNCSSTKCNECYWGPSSYTSHLATCTSCPATWLSNAVLELQKHPTMISLFGIEIDCKHLRVSCGSGTNSPLSWALYGEISRHQMLESLDLTCFKRNHKNMAVLGEWLEYNSLLKKVKLPSFTFDGDFEFRCCRDRSYQYRLATAAFVRGCSNLGLAAICSILEFVYGVGRQAAKFLRYKNHLIS